MCDFCSWLEPGKDTYSGREFFTEHPDKDRNYWLNDLDYIHYLQSYDSPRIIDRPAGHGVILDAYGLHEFRRYYRHRESTKNVPPEIAREINEGKMDQQIRMSWQFAYKPDRPWIFSPSGRMTRSKTAYIPDLDWIIKNKMEIAREAIRKSIEETGNMENIEEKISIFLRECKRPTETPFNIGIAYTYEEEQVIPQIVSSVADMKKLVEIIFNSGISINEDRFKEFMRTVRIR